MLGLGVFIGIAKKAYTQFDSLFGALKARSTYYENDGKSRSDVSRISSAGILDKATILLTPTATSDARVHSVKTYTGEELVTNGDFATDSDWTLSSTFEIDNKKLHCVSDGSYQYAYQGNAFVVGNTYKITFDVIDYTSGSIRVRPTGQSGYTAASANGTYTQYFTATDTTLAIERDSACDLYVDNVSVIDVSSDFAFDRASSATRINSSGLVQDMQSITDPELVLNGDFEELGDNVLTSTWVAGAGWSVITDGVSCDGSNGNVRQNIEMTDYNGKTFLLTYTLSNVTDSTTLNAKFGGGSNVALTSTNGTHTVYLTNDATVDNFQFTSGGNWAGDITNISLKQVDPNDRWTVGATWSLGDGVANYEGGSNSAIIQNITLTSGNTYNIKFTVSNASGNASIWIGNGSGGVNYFGGTYAPYANGSYDLYFTMPSKQTTLAFYGASSGPNFSIDNISVKDITFSTDVDLARINYDSNGDNGHILLEPTSTNLLPYSEDFSQWSSSGSATIESGFVSPDGSNSAYKVSGTVGSTTVYYSGVPNLSSTSTRTIWARTVSGTGTINLCSYGQNTNNNFTITEEWQRFEVNGTTTSTGESNFYAVDFRFEESNPLREVIIWGAQAENLTYATSYIPTLTGSTVTREVEKLTGSGNAGLIESRQGSFYVDIAALAPSTGAQISISLSGGSSNDRVLIYSGSGGGEWKVQFRKDSSSYVSISKSATISNQAKIAAAWASGRYVMFVDGVKATAYSTGSETESTTFDGGDLTSVQFSPNNGSGSNLFYGKCKALAVFNEALSDTELENLTS